MFSDNFEIVFHWIENQIRSGKSDLIFLNSRSAERAFKNMGKNLAVLDQDKSDLDHFISVHLNRDGVKKLKTTIRIARLREQEKLTTGKKLQCTLYAAEAKKLNDLVGMSGLTQTDIINRLIREADLSDFSN